MKFSTTTDIDAPQKFSFRAASNFNRMEKQVMRRGIALERVNNGEGHIVGLAWRSRVAFKGVERDVDAAVAEYDAPERYLIAGKSDGLDLRFEVAAVSLAAGRTRMQTTLTLEPRTLTARVLLQSLRLGKSRLDRKFGERVDDFMQGIAERFRDRAS